MKNRVFVYCRKSQESEERQALSIPSQIEELEKVAKRDGLELVAPYYQESQSAKRPGRPVFNQMLKDMESQHIKKVLVWNPDRLSRNSVDSGQIIYMMDQGFLDEVITPAQTIKNTPNDKFLFSILCGQAKLENDNRGINAKRGMTTKANMGWYPAPAPFGYKNTPDRKKGFKIIEVDEITFPLVKRLFDEVLAGKQPAKVYREATKIWRLKCKAGRLLHHSTFYNILNKPFYYGEYEWPKGSGIWYEGKHTPMITREQFDMVQKMLGKKGKPIAKSHKLNFDLTGLFRCKSCGCAITATQKTKHYLTTGRTVTYTYYHCTRKNKDVKCTTKPLTENDLNQQIGNVLASLKPDQEFLDWSKKWLSAVHENESEFREDILESQQNDMKNVENRLNKLLDMRLNEDLDDEVYKNKKNELENEKRQIQESIKESGEGLDDWRIKVERALEFARACRSRFETGTREEKHEILMRIGSNLIINENKLLEIKLKREFGVLADKENWTSKYQNWLEPQKYTEIMEKNSDLRPANPSWLPRVDSDHEPTA